MTAFSLTDCFLYVGNYDFTTDSNNAVLTTDVATLDATNFNSDGNTEVVGGLFNASLNWQGFWQVDGSSDQAVDNQATLGTSEVYTFGPVQTEGQPVYILNAHKSQYVLGGEVGAIAPFTLNAVSRGKTARGMLAKARGTVSGTGAMGSGVNLGAIDADEYLYATFHNLVPGTTISLTLQSDDNSGFTTPTVRATLSGITTAGGTWVTPVAGPITDTWFRFVVTAITGAHVVAASIGKA